ncbi:hypothetical protein PoB_004622700 [Plakobranchus ocellatus]|uniref:Uncharacterized protein n=1 Tax=Plakobranchus ocellatus TaxID=259542 RepID=A0AAV4BK01_9GAST|nr:hypothetical protein PoB_004622700 [Plakobranchus ocellatus]
MHKTDCANSGVVYMIVSTFPAFTGKRSYLWASLPPSVCVGHVTCKPPITANEIESFYDTPSLLSCGGPLPEFQIFSLSRAITHLS